MSEVPTYADSAEPGRKVARLAGRAIAVDVGRVRAYPGHSSEAPDTRGYYALATHALAGARRVLDIGAGAGHGTRVLQAAFESVIAIDVSRDAVAYAKALVPGADVVRADACMLPKMDAVDGAVLVDVLGHAEDARAMLRAVHARLRPGGRIVVAEARAYPSQSLRSPARRAFSPRALESLLAAMGFDIDERFVEPGPFVAFVAHAAAGDDADALVAASRALARGDAARALASLDRAAESARTAVRLDALVSLGDVRLALGDGDGAARAFLAARGLDDRDPRSTVGLARITLAMGDRADALELARRALALDATCLGATCTMAMALQGTRISTQNAVLRAAAALAPDDHEIAMAFAASCGADERKPAIFAMERARRYGAAKASAAFHVLLAELLLDENRREDATLEARLADTIAPNAPEVAMLWARVRAATRGDASC